MLTIKKVVDTIKKRKASQPHHIEDVVPLKFIGNGSFREVYAVKGLRVVIKFPFDSLHDLTHAQDEIKALKSLEKAPPKLKGHVPKVYYTNSKTGVVVMRKYKRNYAAGHRLQKLLAEFFGCDAGDYGWQNFGRDGNKLVVIDLGIT